MTEPQPAATGAAPAEAGPSAPAAAWDVPTQRQASDAAVPSQQQHTPSKGHLTGPDSQPGAPTARASHEQGADGAKRKTDAAGDDSSAAKRTCL